MTAAPATTPLLIRLVKGIFYPVACICMRHGMSEQQAGEILRWCYVKAALTEPEFAASGRNAHRQTVSHAAVQTGLTRMEAVRYSRLDAPEVERIGHGTDRATRVLSAWHSDPRYHDAKGRPADLALRGRGATFQELTMKWGRDTPPRCIADILVAARCAEWVDGKRKSLRFVSNAYRGLDHTIGEWESLSVVAADFARSLHEALRTETMLRPRFRQSFFLDVRAKQAAHLRELLHERMAVFSKECDDLISTYRTEDTGVDTVRVGTGSFSFFEAGSRR